MSLRVGFERFASFVGLLETRMPSSVRQRRIPCNVWLKYSYRTRKTSQSSILSVRNRRSAVRYVCRAPRCAPACLTD